jgi:hypothetical protein
MPVIFRCYVFVFDRHSRFMSAAVIKPELLSSTRHTPSEEQAYFAPRFRENCQN